MSGRPIVFCALALAALSTLLWIPGKTPERPPTAERTIREALKQPIQVDFKEVPLADVADFFQEKLNVQIVLDKRALDDVGIGTDTPVSFRVSGISARSTLDLILRQIDLTWIVRDEVLLITTPERAESTLETKVYDVADLVQTTEDPEGQPDFDSLTEMITSCVDPATWDAAGGPGSICPFQAAGIKALVFSQTQQVHEKAADLLAQLRAVRRDQPAAGGTGLARVLHRAVAGPPTERAVAGLPTEPQGATEGLPSHLETSGQQAAGSGDPRRAQDPRRAREAKIRQALAKRIDAQFIETPLSSVVDYLQDTLKIPIQFDRRAMDDVGIGTDVPVSIRLKALSTRSVLNLMLRQLDLTWTIADEVLLITTPEREEARMVQRVYDVSDLPAWRNQQGEGVPDFDAMVDMIAGTIHPSTWDRAGGPGQIAPLPANGLRVLVISQAREVHEAVADLLGQLRAVRGRPPSKEDIQKLPEGPPPKPQGPMMMGIGGPVVGVTGFF